MLTSAMKAAFTRTELFPLATASAAGEPNVIPVKWVEVVADDEIWITDNYLCKTLANLRENPRAALYLYSAEPKCCIQVKGRVEILVEGEAYQRMRSRVLEVKPDLPARALLILRVEAIYQCLPGLDAGQRIWPPA